MVDQADRLAELHTYRILDSPPEQEFDDLSELASLIFDTPISLLTFLDDKRQWFKVHKGLSLEETAVQDAFCVHALDKPSEVLIVNDALEDPRFVSNNLVTGFPNIRFYAGAPLVTPSGNVLGTLCVIDTKPRKVEPSQIRALQTLAKRAMDQLELRKLLKEQATNLEMTHARLHKLTQNIPSGIFQLKVMPPDGFEFMFLSDGMQEIHPGIDLEAWIEDPTIGFSLVHPEDVEPLRTSIIEAAEHNTVIYHEYRVKSQDEYKWHAMSARPEITADGEIIFYGSFIDVTHHHEYEELLERVSFDISHVMRKPVTSIMGLTHLLERADLEAVPELKDVIKHIKEASLELDKFTRQLNDVYLQKKEIISKHTRKPPKS